ncbi:MAG: Lrp/AsnC family transcriptional regulator [Candidatus Micrarchaeaceae archaeon]
MNNRLDDLDKKMLNLLSTNGRISIKDLSKSLGISPPAAKKRYDRLFKDGYIEGVTVTINLKKVGFNLSFLSMVKVSDANYSIEISKELIKFDEVLSVDIITGEYDLIFRGAVQDQDRLFDLITKVQSIPHVERLFTMIILKSLGNKIFHL